MCCLSLAAFSHYCTNPDVTWGNGRRCPLVVRYWADLQSVHGFRCFDNIARTRNVSECLYSLYAWLLTATLFRSALGVLRLCGRTGSHKFTRVPLSHDILQDTNRRSSLSSGKWKRKEVRIAHCESEIILYKRNFQHVDEDALVLLYKALVWSHLEYVKQFGLLISNI